MTKDKVRVSPEGVDKSASELEYIQEAGFML